MASQADTPETPLNGEQGSLPQINALAQYIKDLSVENPSSLEVDVSVRGSADGSSLILAPVPAATSATTQDVLDQGEEWFFSFSAAGVEGGTVRVSRAKLAADGWRVEVPESVIRQLQSGRFVPAYRR